MKATFIKISRPGVHKFFIKPRSYLQILGFRILTWRKFHIEDQQIFGGGVWNLFSGATWYPRILRSWSRPRNLLFHVSTFISIYGRSLHTIQVYIQYKSTYNTCLHTSLHTIQVYIKYKSTYNTSLHTIQVYMRVQYKSTYNTAVY
jgi:hypothetical protein